MENVNIVFLTANPTRDLSLDEDLRGIKLKLSAAKYGDVLLFNVCPAARIDDMLQAMYKTPPRIVHFSGHGETDGLMFVGDDGTPRVVSGEDLQDLFKAFRDGISVVVLSACSTSLHAEAIAEIVGCAIGTPSLIEDQAAIRFNAEFYRAIAFGESIQGAYDKACSVLGVENLDTVRPVLMAREGVDPKEMILVPKPTRALQWLAGGAVVVVAAWLTLTHVLGGPGAATPAQPIVRLGNEQSRGGGSLPSEDLAAAREHHRVGDYAASFPLFKRAAEAGSVEAMGFLGTAYLRGEGTVRRPELAAQWLSLAARSGDARGMNAYGVAFENGFGVARDYGLARQWYERAAAQDYAEAMWNLGRIHREGIGTLHSDSLALLWYRKAAARGSVDAMNDMGRMYENGWGVPPDRAEAARWFRQAAETRRRSQ